MKARLAWLATALASWAALAHAATGPVSLQPLVARMTRAGHAEARVVVTVGMAGDSATSRRGTLALEPPNRMRLDYAVGGERLAARGDGGEWLQPDLKQMLTLTAAQAKQASAMWDVMQARSSSYAERRIGARTWRLVTTESAAGEDSVLLTVGADRLPSKIEAHVGDLHWTIRLANWRFTPAKGREGFVLHAPPGYEVMAMP